MGVSVICTIKNEESSIKELIDSLIFQSKMPSEIIIVDGGSSDNTMEIVNSYIKSGFPIKLIVESDINISEGRNIAVKKSNNDYIASIDAGCRADKNWLKNLLKPFEKDSSVDVVAGFFLPDAKTRFEEVVSKLLYPSLELLNPDGFLPSGRSIAFKKAIWEKVGGYPEWLYTAEDSLFDLKLKEIGCKFAFVKDAAVYWRPRSSLPKLFKQYYLYAKGASKAGIVYSYFEPYGTNIIKYLSYFLQYSLYLITKAKIIHLFYVPLILLTVFIAKITGIIAGKLSKSKFNRKRTNN